MVSPPPGAAGPLASPPPGNRVDLQRGGSDEGGPAMSVQSQEGDTEAAAQVSLETGMTADTVGPCTQTSLLHPLVSCG